MGRREVYRWKEGAIEREGRRSESVVYNKTRPRVERSWEIEIRKHLPRSVISKHAIVNCARPSMLPDKEGCA